MTKWAFFSSFFFFFICCLSTFQLSLLGGVVGAKVQRDTGSGSPNGDAAAPIEPCYPITGINFPGGVPKGAKRGPLVL